MPYLYNGKKYRSYKHPILEYIFEQKTKGFTEFRDEIVFTYEDIRQAMAALKMERDKQASISNFTIDLTRRASIHESRVPASIWDRGYDLDRASDREMRQNVAGRLVRKDLKPEAWLKWRDFVGEDVIVVPNTVPVGVRPYLGKDEGALLSVMDYCDVLSIALHNEKGTIKRVQHPKKWQPGEVDGLYFSDYEEKTVLYPVEAKALSTGDSVNLAQIQGAYRTIVAKIADAEIVPLAVQMIPEGMYVAVFEVINRDSNELSITRQLKVEIVPLIETWQPKMLRKKKT